MSLTSEKRQLIRAFVRKALGDECSKCGSTFNLEVHHKIPCGVGVGRGSTWRCWDWMENYMTDNIELLCHECHVEHHKQTRLGENDVW